MAFSSKFLQDLTGNEAIVASDGNYTTVKAAIDDGKGFIVLRGAVTDASAITLATTDVQIYMLPGAVWTIQGTVTLDGYYLSVQGQTNVEDINNCIVALEDQIVDGTGPSTVLLKNIQLTQTTSSDGINFTDNGSIVITENCKIDSSAGDIIINNGGATSLTSHRGSSAYTTISTGEMKSIDVRNCTVDTTDATATVIGTVATDSNVVYMLDVDVIGVRTGGVAGTAGDNGVYKRSVQAVNKAGILTIGTPANILTEESQAGWDVTFVVNTTNIEVKVTGAVDNNVTWNSVINIKSVKYA